MAAAGREANFRDAAFDALISNNFFKQEIVNYTF